MEADSREARFGVGQLVQHRRFGYRGVVFDVDPVFQLTEEWYDSVAKSRPPKDRPWYHVLVDGSDGVTYVAERHLEADESGREVRHPLVAERLGPFADGRYAARSLN